ncbi:ubiquitin carboxyl-terminal hydrolase 16-like isoform X7 [Penaeus japonicus]|nr:ubiquitin carboxyl-terminal hydrolase 16-like isoform X7 [Penaeus japonicus]XP_042876124.1 ubiquitin carboxyl-terminal hydrolase 16-like isoform X7 [Penaeus japonicus]
MKARKKRQADPYAEESSDGEEEETPASGPEKEPKNESKACGHANRAVNFSLVRKALKQGQPIGDCTQCRKGHRTDLKDEAEDATENYVPVIWLCLFCGHQGCDRNTQEQHSFLHYRTPRSDPHCLILNTQAWNVWCYDCDSEVHQTSSKKLHEIVEYIKRQKDMAPRRSVTSQPVINKPSHTSGNETGTVTLNKGTVSSFDDNSKAAKNQRNAQASVLASLPKVKGLSNLGNTCFFNSVMQCLAQTHFLTQLLDVQCQSGQRVYLPGQAKSSLDDPKKSQFTENGRIQQKKEKIPINENEEDVELKPLDLILPEGGGLTLATAAFLKDMHSVGKNGVLNPGHLFGQICKKSTQFQGYEQQDAHELLRCLLDAIRNEEILRAKRAILKAFALSEKTDPNTVSPRLKTMIKGYGKQATHTLVDHIFGGHLISTVFCEECHWSSQVFEPFMDLSLPINEEKGKPKKTSPSDDESLLDCFGRQSSNNNVSKHQQKKKKKEEKKARKTKGRAKGGGLAPACIRANTEDQEEEQSKKTVQSEKMKRRTTEKRRPEDLEDTTKTEEEQKAKGGKNTGILRGESFKFRQLMAARRINRQEKDSGEEESGEDSEYDQEDDEEEETNGNKNNVEGNADDMKRGTEETKEKTDQCKDDKGLSKAADEDEEESEEEDDDEDDDDEDESEETDDDGKDNESDIASSKKKSSTEISDADIEDNTDSERVRHKYHNTRQPSIVVEQSENETRTSDGITANHKENYIYIFTYNLVFYRRKPAYNPRTSLLRRCLKSCYSSDQLNYNSASDTSERYFTPNERDCNGLDTGDDLDNFQDPVEKAETTSVKSDKSTNTSGIASSCVTGDSLSISSGDTINNFEGGTAECKVPVDQAHMEEMCLKVGELKIRRKSSSKESLLDTHSMKQKRGSTETLHTFKERLGEEEEDETKKKAKNLKKLKQEWIARSLTTLAPRYQCHSQECSIMSCLTNFTAPELLMGNNKITCENCTKIHSQLHGEENVEPVKSNASKQLLILSPPAVLTLQLKRFHHMGFNLTKVNRYVRFPLVLDIAPFTSSISLGLGNMSRGQKQVLYGLYSVVEHSGRLNSGHYVAYVRSRPLDPNRTNKQFLNLKPSSQFEINHLVTEMAEKIEASSGMLDDDLKGSSSNTTSVNVEELEEEVKAGRWFHVSDAYVAEVNIERVMKAQAYLLFYERLV